MNQKQTPEIPQNWDFSMCRIENKPASIRTNLGLYNVAPLEGYTHRLQFYIEMKHPTSEGLSSNEEYPILCDIEDAICESAEGEGAIMVSAIKNDGFLELWFYSHETEILAKVCQEALSSFEGYHCGYNQAEDPQWDAYFDFLYPDPYSYQAIQNRKVIMQLEQNGDKLEVPREIDHFIYFKTAEQQQGFAKEAQEKGFTVLLNDEEDARTRAAEGQAYPYTVQATGKDSPENINNIVWDIMDLAEPFEGDYDGWGCPNVLE